MKSLSRVCTGFPFVTRSQLSRLRPAGRMTSTNARLKSAGIIVIGDEILKGYTLDSNSHFLCQELLKLGVRVERISTIPDDLDVIADEVASFSRRFDHVVTSGGVGPTHDDITFEGVAKGLGDVCALHPQLEAFARDFFSLPKDATLETAPQLKLCFVPSQARLLWGVDAEGRRALYPSIAARNVVVLPGIPALLRKAFAMLKDHFRNHAAALHHRRLYLSVGEFDIAARLTALQKELGPRGLAIGSYPKIDHPYYRVKVTLDAEDEAVVKEAEGRLRDELRDSLLAFDEAPLTDAEAKFTHFLQSTSPELRERLQDSLRQIDSAISEAADPSQICLCFNGGKDCTVLLHLVWLRLRALRGHEANLRVLYIRPQDPFPEMEAFVAESVERYGLEMLEVTGPIRRALEVVKEREAGLEMIFMGTRETDPNWRGQTERAWTDEGWPRFLRLNPVLRWTYGDVWAVLRGLWLPYASLYEKGFTSVGGRANTSPNPDLAFDDSFGLRRFRPAHLLHDPTKERAGRHKAPAPPAK